MIIDYSHITYHLHVLKCYIVHNYICQLDCNAMGCQHLLTSSWSLLHALQWRQNEPDGVSNHRLLHYSLNHLFRPRLKKTSKLRTNGLCEVKSPVTGGFPSQRASNSKYVPILWAHHGKFPSYMIISKGKYVSWPKIGQLYEFPRILTRNTKKHSVPMKSRFNDANA